MLAGAERGPVPAARVQQGTATSNLIDYSTDGADIERSGWVKDEKILTRQNVGTLKLKWKLETGNQPRALHALMPVLVIGQLQTPGGVKQVGIVNGISDNLYAFDVETGKILWQKHWDYPAPAGRGGGAAAAPTGSEAARLPPARWQQRHAGDRSGGRPGPAAGLLRHRRRHAAHHQRGRRHRPAAAVQVLRRQGLGAESRRQHAVDADHVRRRVDRGGARRRSRAQGDDLERRQRRRLGPARRGGGFHRHGVDHHRRRRLRRDQRSAALRQQRGRRADRQNGQLKLKDYYTPTNWEWLRKRDLDPNNTPTVFKYKGRELVAASGKECRLYLLDPESAGGENHQTPAFKTLALLQRGGGLPGHGQLGRAELVGGPGRHALGAGAVLGPGAFAGEVPAVVRARQRRRRRGLQAGRARRQARVRARLGVARHEARRAGADRQRHGDRLRQRRGNEAGVARHRPAVRFVDPRRQGHARDHLCARRDHRQGAVVERRDDAPVQPLFRRHRRQRPHLSRHLRRHACIASASMPQPRAASRLTP